MSTRCLYIGDPHVCPTELDDADALMRCVSDAVVAHRPDRVVFLGDEFHTHAIVHLEVMHWWVVNLLSLGVRVPTWVLVGNHDKCGNGRSDIHALEPMKHIPGVTVVEAPVEFLPGVLVLPHMDTWEGFRTACEQNPVPVAVCHNTFKGTTLENGFYAPDGFDVTTLPQEMFLSGHIHTPQEFGKVWYLGAPRWRIATDANVDRALWLVTHGDDGRVVARTPLDTGTYCRRIINADEVEGGQLDPEGYDTKKDDVRLTITGSEAFLKASVPVRTAQGFRVRTVKVGAGAVARVRESEGIPQAFRKFAGAYECKRGTPRDVLLRLAAERLATGG
jgi:hypothetical protein